MNKKALIILVIFSLAFSLSTAMLPQDKALARSILIKDADNKKCPVTGKEIKRKKYNTTYKGKRYWFSYYKALKKFKQDPEQYMDDYSDTAGRSRERNSSWY